MGLRRSSRGCCSRPSGEGLRPRGPGRAGVTRITAGPLKVMPSSGPEPEAPAPGQPTLQSFLRRTPRALKPHPPNATTPKPPLSHIGRGGQGVRARHDRTHLARPQPTVVAELRLRWAREGQPYAGLRPSRMRPTFLWLWSPSHPLANTRAPAPGTLRPRTPSPPRTPPRHACNSSPLPYRERGSGGEPPLSQTWERGRG